MNKHWSVSHYRYQMFPAGVHLGCVGSYASSGRWKHQQLSSGTGITRNWEGGNVAEMARTCLKVCVVRVGSTVSEIIFSSSREWTTSV